MIRGSHPRRTILKAGLGGFASLSLADVLRLQHQSLARESRPVRSERTAVILVWLRGGASHLETFAVDNYDNFTIAGPTYPGPAYRPFSVVGDLSNPKFEVPNIGMPAEHLDRMQRRMSLKNSFDRLRSGLDVSGTLDAIGRFEGQALSLLTSPEAGAAFDLKQEPIEVRERYGMNALGAAMPDGASIG